MRPAVLLQCLFTLLLAACSDAPAPLQPVEKRIARIEVTPSALLLTAAGQSRQLIAQAFDAEGRPVTAAFKWTSLNPDAVQVDSTGTLTSLGPRGSAQIIVEAQDVRAHPALVLVARPVPGALLVSDGQIREGPTVLNPEWEGPVGSRSSVLLGGVGLPAPGTVILASESIPLAGKVVSSASEGENARVVIEVVPLPEILADFSFNETFRVREDALKAGNRLGERSVMRSTERGLEVTYSPRPGITLKAAGFECNGSAGPRVRLDNLSVSLNSDVEPVLTVKSGPDGHLEQLDLGVEGEFSVTTSGGLFLDVDFHGESTCTLTLASIPLPIGGLLSVFFSPGLELAAELRLSGNIQVGTVEVGLEGKLGLKTESGFTYRAHAKDGIPAGYTPRLEVEPVFSLSPKYNAATPQGARADVEVFVGPVLKLQARAVTASVDLVEGRVGLNSDISLAHLRLQALDPEYASAYSLHERGEVSLGSGIARIIKALGAPPSVSVEARYTLDSQPLASSPTGSLNLSRTHVQPGNEVTFELNLEHVTFPFIQGNVQSVQLYAFRDEQEPVLLATLRPSTPTQTRFEHTWQVPRDWHGQYPILAFTTTVLAPELPLEITANSRKLLTVSEPCAPLPSNPDSGSGCTGSSTWQRVYRYQNGDFVHESSRVVNASNIEFVNDRVSPDRLTFMVTKATITISGVDTSRGLDMSCKVFWGPTTFTVENPGSIGPGYLEVDTSGLAGIPQGTYHGYAMAYGDFPIARKEVCDPGGPRGPEVGMIVHPQFFEILNPLSTPDAERFVLQAEGVLAGETTIHRGSETVRSSWNFHLPGVNVE